MNDYSSTQKGSGILKDFYVKGSSSKLPKAAMLTVLKKKRDALK